MSYQGWTNYETWALALWIDNEEGSYLEWRDVAREYDATDDASVGELAKRMKDEISDSAPDLGACVWSDFIQAALSEVNWYELAESRFEE